MSPTIAKVAQMKAREEHLTSEDYARLSGSRFLSPSALLNPEAMIEYSQRENAKLRARNPGWYGDDESLWRPEDEDEEETPPTQAQNPESTT